MTVKEIFDHPAIKAVEMEILDTIRDEERCRKGEDAKLKNTQTISTLSNMALITGRSIVRISGGTFYKNVYGGGDMARIVNEGNEATYLEISDNADVRGAVFAAGNGREKSESYVAGKTLHPELVGKVTGNTNVSFYGTTTQAPYMYGDIFGAGVFGVEAVSQIHGMGVAVSGVVVSSLAGNPKSLQGVPVSLYHRSSFQDRDVLIFAIRPEAAGELLVKLEKELPCAIVKPKVRM